MRTTRQSVRMMEVDMPALGEEDPELTPPAKKKRSSKTDDVSKCPRPSGDQIPADVEMPSEDEPDQEIILLYTSKIVTPSKHTLETIFERPKILNGAIVVMGKRKYKRLITFQQGNIPPPISKIKKRRAKINKMLDNQSVERTAVPMELFYLYMQTIDLLDKLHVIAELAG